MIADHMINYKIGCDRFAWNWMCMIILFGEKQEQFKVYNYEIIINYKFQYLYIYSDFETLADYCYGSMSTRFVSQSNAAVST